MTHPLQSIAWTLIHFCWQAAAIAAAFRLQSFAFARRSSNARYLAALTTLLLMLAASVATLAWELRAEPESQSAQPAVVAVNNPAPWDLPHVMEPGHYSARTAPPSLPFSAVLPWIDGIWIVGVIGLSLRSLGGWFLIDRLYKSASAEVPDAVAGSFLRMCAKVGLRRPVMLRVSKTIAGPVTIGALRAVVLLPLSAITSLGPNELEMVLAHELAHVCRADYFWNLVQTLAETLFFFHPAVWWINARIRHERELCCDDLALKVCPNPIAYADALFRLEEQRSRHWRLAMALNGHQSQQTLRMRIARILGEPVSEPRRPVRPFSLVAACASLTILLLPVPQVLASLDSNSKAGHASASGTHTPSSTLSDQARQGDVLASEQAVLVDPFPHALLVDPPDPKPAPAKPSPSRTQEKPDESAQPKSNYIDRMKAAGYDVDLDKYIAMKIQGVTPDYARAMSQLGFGKPSADDLVACKIQGVTPESITQLKQQGLEVKSLQDAISYRIFSVTPEFVAGMKAAGFDHLTSKQLLSMRVQGVTPEYARAITKQFPGATAEDLVKTRIFNIDAAFIASANKHGFSNLTLEKLVQLRISGVLDDDSK